VTAHAHKPDFVFRRNGRVRLNRWGRQFSRILAAKVCASAVLMLDTPCSLAVWRALAIHSIRPFPLHFPHPCVTVCHHISSGLYHRERVIVPVDRRFGGSQSRSGPFGEQHLFLTSNQTMTPRLSCLQPSHYTDCNFRLHSSRVYEQQTLHMVITFSVVTDKETLKTGVQKHL
jgi:hypothetical protein